jgi:L-alanine-DL-glutamate epimerase-like enolase superfamily enzyme
MAVTEFSAMAVSRAERRIARTERAREVFGDDAEVALDPLN